MADTDWRSFLTQAQMPRLANPSDFAGQIQQQVQDAQQGTDSQLSELARLLLQKQNPQRANPYSQILKRYGVNRG